ncbi:MAG: alpha/beta fold hydrolase [Gammaproteobacteria bacterium]|nr:alpha/beta fold hydrolase [Gammaproteobacteria bacterium]
MNQSDITLGTELKSKQIEIDHVPMHYFEQGKGDPIILLHSVPASAWIWRDIIPHLAVLGRCIALDLPGFGQSGKPNTPYPLEEQIHLIEKFIDTLQLEHITFILHGWGSIPGLDYAMRHPKKCKGLVFYEAWLCSPQGEYISLPYQEYILYWQKEKNREQVMTNGIQFVNQTLQQFAIQPFDENTLAHYYAPFLQTGTGKSLYQYLKDSPSGDGKSVADKIISQYSKKLAKSDLPKLLLYSIPGFVTTIEALTWAREHLPVIEVAEVGEDLHFGQESNPTLMGESISIWMQAVEQNYDRG